MRALIVASMATDPSFVADLAARCDLVIAADGGGSVCLSADVAPDLVVGDLDSLAREDELRLREAGARFKTVPAEKDVTDLDLALDAARDAEASEIWLTGVLGGRLDHTLAAIGTLRRHADRQPRVLEPDARGWLLSCDGRSRLELGGLGALVSLFAVGGQATVTCSGLKYPLSEEALGPLDSRGLSNVLVDKEATIEVFAGVLLVLSVLTNGTLLARERVSAPHVE